jgi:hypothetical protein
LSGSYTTFSGSASTRITANSSSIQQVSSSQQQISASLLNVVANYATTGSNSFRANQSITGSLVVSSTITAQTLVVQTVTSSILYSSGSNVFGNQLANTQTFTGSVNITGSQTVFGNVGIGAASPDTKLHISGSDGIKIQATGNSDTPSLTIINNTNQYGWARFSGGLQGNGKGYAAISCWNASTVGEVIRISGDGNIGIGTTTIDDTLSVDIQNLSPTSNNIFLRLKNNVGSEDCGIKIAGIFGTAYEHIFGVNTIMASGDLIFHNANTLGYRWMIDGSHKLGITGAGNVGIGITSPQTNLSIKGIATNATVSTYNGIFGLESVNQTSFQMGIGSTYNGTWFQSFNQPATGGGTYNLIFNPLGGSVGIGTTSPTAKLEVRGTADGDLFIGRFHAGSAKLIYAYQYGSDGYLELRTGADATITKLSGYSGTASYFLSNVAINTTTANTKFTVVDNAAPNASGNITTGAQFAASISSGYASLNVGAYDDGGSNRYGYLRTAYSDNAGIPSEMRFYTAATERMRISTGGIVTQPYQPAFSVANGAATTGPTTVAFKNVLFDDGSNFNTTTYRFTAPVAGRYFFSFYDNIYANIATSPNMEFRVNGTRRGALAYTNTKTIGYWYIMSFQQVIKLSSGDYVEVYLGAADNADYGGDYSWGNFSGFLIG